MSKNIINQLEHKTHEAIDTDTSESANSGNIVILLILGAVILYIIYIVFIKSSSQQQPPPSQPPPSQQNMHSGSVSFNVVPLYDYTMQVTTIHSGSAEIFLSELFAYNV
jgi:hypothetical protein